MQLQMSLENWLTLGVAVITWGGVFLYLLRLNAVQKKLEEQMRDLAIESKEAA